MLLSYVDFLTGERHQMNATITTDHPASSYGQPVVIIEDGDPVNFSDWVLLQYRVEAADAAETVLLEKFLDTLNAALDAATITDAMIAAAAALDELPDGDEGTEHADTQYSD